MWAAIALVLLAANLAAQSPPTLTLQNLAPFARREGVAVVVPFAPGVAKGKPQWHVPQQATAWQHFGACWPDGSWRQALCLFVAALPATAEQRVQLATGPGPDLPTGDFPGPTCELEFVLQQGTKVTRAIPAPIKKLEANALRRVELHRTRIGDSGLVAELILTIWRDQPHAHVDVAVFFSDPSTAAMQCEVDELAIECRGMALLLRHPGRLGINQATTNDGSRTVLLQKNWFGDGQGLRRTGVLVPPLSSVSDERKSTLVAACVAPLLGATEWRQSRAFGPFGLVPELPPWLQGGAVRRHLARRHRDFVARDQPGGDPFGIFPHGLAKGAGQGGDQPDFGVVQLSVVAATGLPSMLLEVELSVLQEACRPVHFYEADGSPVEPARHPDWVVWAGCTHWHPDVSKDRLGKPAQTPPFDTHGWTGKDRQHWTSLYLSAYALLTGSHWARAELANEARLYLAGQTVRPDLSTSHGGSPRGAGRTAHTAAWNLLIADDAALRQRMDERMDRVYAEEWFGRNMPADRVRPYLVNAPDGRQLQGKYPFWNPWQDATAAIGFAAHHLVTGNAKAREIAELLAINVVRHGWLVDANTNEVAMAVRWMDGEPLTAAQLTTTDHTLVQWSQGTAFSEWSIGAVEIARVASARNGDEALAAKAAEIQRRMRQNRRPPREDGVDRFTEWDAVAWH